jgi:hypothetical protein
MLLGSFIKLRQAIISFAMSACRFVRMEKLGSHWNYFLEI